jgi:site-specific recombinase XerD
MILVIYVTSNIRGKKMARRKQSTELSRAPDGELVESGVPWQRVLETYLNTLDSDETLRKYRQHLEACFQTLRKPTIAMVTGEELAQYRAALLKDGRGPASHAQALSAVRSFMRWAGIFGAHMLPLEMIRELLKLSGAKVEKPYEVLTNGEIEEVYGIATSPRDRALLSIALGVGLRVSELAKLDIRDIKETEDGGAQIHVRGGKGAKDRTVPLIPQAMHHVRNYLASTYRTLSSEGALFLAEDRAASQRTTQRLTARAIGKLVERIIDRAEIIGKRISPHSLRHTMAIRYLRENPGDIVGLSKILGHSSVTTTQRYVDHLEREELAKRMPPLPGLW